MVINEKKLSYADLKSVAIVSFELCGIPGKNVH